MAVDKHLLDSLRHVVPLVLVQVHLEGVPVVPLQFLRVNLEGVGQDAEGDPAPFDEDVVNPKIKNLAYCLMCAEKAS